MTRTKSILKYIFAVFFILAGLNHFRIQELYVRMMPPSLPWPLLLVYVSGLAEILLGMMLLVPSLVRLAAWGLVVLLIGVFPANIHMAVHAELFPEFNAALLWARLPVQALLIAWAYWYVGDDGRREA
jgi:uncharacterized membrane protein